MNEEAKVVMAFFTFRVFLVGAIMFAFPRIARKGLMFGTYLGEENVEDGARTQLLRGWDRGCAMVMLVALAVGWTIGLGGRPVPGNLIGTVVLLLPFGPLYFWTYRKARGLASDSVSVRGSISVASLEVDESRGEGFALLALIVSVAASLALLSYAVLSFRTMPPRTPTLGSLWGFGDSSADASLVSVILIPSFNFVFSPIFPFMGLLIARAKRSIRSGSGGGSAMAQATFRRAVSHLFAGAGLFLCLVLAVVSWEMIKVWQGRAESLGHAPIAWTCVLMVLFLGAGLFRIMWMGQGGARLETGSPNAPLAGGLADNSRWLLGIWYVNRNDPALLVETRFGIGYTMNLGNRISWVILGVFLTELLGLAVLTLMQMGVL